MKSLCLSLALCAFTLVNSQLCSGQSATTQDDRFAQAILDLQTDRVSQAIDITQSLKRQQPDDPGIAELDGVAALYAGVVPAALSDFTLVLRITKDPFAEYGVALCSALSGKPQDSLMQLDEIDSSSLENTDEQVEVQTFKALCLNSSGDRQHALTLLHDASDPAAQEMYDLNSPISSSEREAMLQAFLDSVAIDGIPQVTEPIGLRLCIAPPAFAIESDITDTAVRGMLLSRFDNGSTQQQGVPLSDFRADTAGGEIDHQRNRQLWELVRIQPSYTAAEYTLAQLRRQSGDRQGYAECILRTAALDPDYRDVRSRIHPLFSGIVPNVYPLPSGMSLPKSMGLSAGTASRAGFWAGSPHGHELALTFDDGPLAGPSAQLVRALEAAHAHATFFVVGMRAAQSPDSLRMMAAAGDDVEDHSYSHPNLTQVLPEHVLQEIVRTGVIIQAATGVWPRFLRPPGGNTNSLVLETARACGMSGAFWTVDALPAEDTGSAQAVVKWVLGYASPGAIILLHNGMESTIAAIPKMVAGLRHEGFNLVTIRQLSANTLARR